MNTASQAREARELGMTRAADRANRVVENWTLDAFKALERFFSARRQPMIGEDVREALYQDGLPRPPDERAWGSVFSRARRSGLLYICGTAPAKSSNMSPKPLWAACWGRA